ncbi:hypothetical protein B0T10DRAFT_465747 [Thelonectria olida]|uniref:Uncharacterized protein n=1 Tax=Thelonectria olida TaxID=1576542 RepID=A0A9P8VTI2_9HYPO|nr:hypothetical protein B0T10DRAFT_465747 [Thelonectria olida]
MGIPACIGDVTCALPFYERAHEEVKIPHPVQFPKLSERKFKSHGGREKKVAAGASANECALHLWQYWFISHCRTTDYTSSTPHIDKAAIDELPEWLRAKVVDQLEHAVRLTDHAFRGVQVPLKCEQISYRYGLPNNIQGYQYSDSELTSAAHLPNKGLDTNETQPVDEYLGCRN